MDIVHIQKMIDDGYISRRKHPIENLYILNYTQKCQSDWNWNKSTLVCRGLIVDDKWNIIARPFLKFFTPDQWRSLRSHTKQLVGVKYKDLFKGKFEVSEKMDGSLGILYFDSNDNPCIATRGSFESLQAIEGTRILREKYPLINRKNFYTDNYTYLFEIIYPENKIVVDYGDEEKLVLLAVISNETGEEIFVKDVDFQASLISDEYNKNLPSMVDFINPKKIKIHKDTFIWNDKINNLEGYVVHFPETGIRVKLKTPEYLRLHKLLTGINERHIWEWLFNDDKWQEQIKDTPPDFYYWVCNKVDEYEEKFKEIEKHIRNILNEDLVKRDIPLTRKQLAIKYQDYKYKAVMFNMLDNKQYHKTIWKLVKNECVNTNSTPNTKIAPDKS